jgi:hypothetical protein
MSKIVAYSQMQPGYRIDYLNTYSVGAYCANCRTHDALRIAKGTPKPQTWKCSNCGCDTLTT